MRRTLALVGAAALAVAGLAGPASANDNGVSSHGDVALSEVGVVLDTTVEGSYGEIESFEPTGHDLDGFELWGCTASDAFLISDYGTGDVIDLTNGPFYLTADIDYSGGASPDRLFPSDAQGDLNQVNGGVFLRDTTVTPNQDRGVQWGMPHPACRNLDKAIDDASPTDLQSLHFDGTNWDLDDPSPESQIG